MPLPDKIVKEIKSVIQKFINENGSGKSEEDVQTSYTLEILKLLGWNSANWKINTSQDVKTGNKPDILLKGSAGGTIFIIESKAPKQSLDGKYINKTFPEQTCEYCNSEGIYWGILTNFIEWRIYNSYTKEIYYDKKYFTLVDNHINIDESIFELFEKIEYKNLNTKKGKIDTNPLYYKKQDEIKDEFFVNLKQWRKDLRDYLYNIFKKKSDKNIPEIVERLTQKILDRMIFIEVCNDKNIISNDILGSILYSKRNKYEELKVKFKELDEKFNSDLFADDVDLDSLEIDDEPMEDIIRGINNIDFSSLSVHIIGEVYENYLGELLKKRKEEIKIDETKQRAKRKEQGIYYTPDYIVNYIVENTLGEILKNCKTHDEIQKIRVLDPACGSGSFLIRAFDEFYKAYDRVYSSSLVIPERSYRESTETKRKNQYTQKSLFDDFEIKKKILLYNLYGVDLDERAVDIAKLNLLIKALEGISDTALEGKRKLLPNLNLNIRCGNSLVFGKTFQEYVSDGFFKGSEILSNKDIDELIVLKEKFRTLLEDNEKSKILREIYIIEQKINEKRNNYLKNYFKNVDEIKPFDFKISFCEVLNDGGFDCIIGNPPYINVENIPENLRNYLMNEYSHIQKRFDIYIAFIEIGLKNLNKNGKLSYILPFPFLNQNYAQNIREYILNDFSINKILDLSDHKIFSDAVVRNVIFVLTNMKSYRNIVEIFKPKDLELNNHLENLKRNRIYQTQFYRFPKSMYRIDINKKQINIFKKIDEQSIIVEDICYVNWGLRTGNVNEFIINKIKNKKCKPMLDGRDIDRYQIHFDNKFVIYDKEKLYNPMFEELFENNKLIIRDISGKNRLKCTFDNKHYYTEHTVSLCVMKSSLSGIKRKDMYFSKEELKESNKYHIKYVLGLINSLTINNYFQYLLGGGLHVYPDDIKNLPIKKIDFTNKQEKSLHDKLVKLVDEMLALNKNPEKNDIKIKAKDKEIDDLVYKLYNLTEEEIKIVEGK